MAEVTLQHVKKAYGPVTVIPDLEPRHPGPRVHGAGRALGLRQVDGAADDRRAWRRSPAATIEIGDRVVNDVPPKDRDIAMVFQSYALYPHMTVRENLEFGLKIRKTPQAEIEPARRRGGADPRHHRAPRPQAQAALRRPAPARRRRAAPSCASPPSSSSTSRCRTSTPSCACRCAPRSRSSRSACRRPPSTSPTTRSRP